ncbi:MAG: nucleotide exchange factor GrpE [Emcibacter sp.]|nr:nucleotide exchange factor GrpE [Emcibacter sp.]
MTDNIENNDDTPETEISEANTPEENTAHDAPAEKCADDKLADAITENANLKDRLLRAIAETENLRRRSDREKADAANYAITAFARDLLNVSDNLRRALDSIPADSEIGENAKTLCEGIELTERELLNMLERHNIKKVDPMGEKFDHNLHQALFEVPNTGTQDGTIVQVMQVGYTIKDRLLRPAMVGVARDAKETPPPHLDTKV